MKYRISPMPNPQRLESCIAMYSIMIVFPTFEVTWDIDIIKEEWHH